MHAARVVLAYREPFLSDLARAVLTRAGFEVLATESGLPSDLVVTDDSSVAAAYPGARVVLLWEDGPGIADCTPDAVVAVPFTPASLLAGVSRATG